MSSTAISRGIFVLVTYVLGSLLGGSRHRKSHADNHRSKQNNKTIHHGANGNNASRVSRTQAAMNDRIVNLPNLDFDPGFEQFGGYFDPAPSRHVYYWLVESQNDPANDPVVLWTNGGPGCSGLVGFGTEHGPFYISEPHAPLETNPYSWNKVANMLYLEQPAGVGFSYADTKEDYATGDAQASLDNFHVILEFFLRFPELQSNKFYIASESYGGHYVPQLALEILSRDTSRAINFAGFLVGNPWVDPYTNTITQFHAYYSHGLLAKPLFQKWQLKCEDPLYFDSFECKELIIDMFLSFGHGVNPYALDYPVCTKKAVIERDDQERRHRNLGNHVSVAPDQDAGQTVITTASSQVNMLLNQTGRESSFPVANTNKNNNIPYKPCSEVYFEEYVNRHDVRSALHVLDRSSRRPPRIANACVFRR
jgi:hypothetical protein